MSRDLVSLMSKIHRNSDGVSTRKGQVAEVDGEWCRVIYDESFRRAFPILEEHKDEFEAHGLIGTEHLGDIAGKILLKHKKIKHWTLIPEWTHGQKVEAGLMVLRLQRKLMKHKLYISDPHTNNVTFDDCRPVWIDYDSIQHNLGNPLDMQNWMRKFWYGRKPGAHWNFDFSPGVLNDVIFGPTPLESSIKLMKGEADKKEHKTKWAKYSHAIPEGMNLNNPDTFKGKYEAMKKMFMKIIASGVRIQSVMDIGSSRGNVVKIFALQGCRDLVALELDSQVASELYQQGKEEGIPVTVVNQNLMTLYDAYWRHKSAVDRLRCDLTVAMAVVHHVCYFRNSSLNEFAKQISDLSRQYAIVDWIPYGDKSIKEPKKGYDREHFIKAFKKYFPGEWDSVMSQPAPREMFLFRKK